MSKLLTYFECDAANFGAVMGALAPVMAQVENLRIETSSEREPRRRLKAANNSPENSGDGHNRRTTRPKNSKIEKIIFEVLDRHPLDEGASYAEFQEALTRDGYSPKSLSPAICILDRYGVVRTDTRTKRAWLLPSGNKETDRG